MRKCGTNHGDRDSERRGPDEEGGDGRGGGAGEKKIT